MRVTISYRAVELGLSVVWLGVITAVFAVLPMVFAVKVGRFIDRGNDARTAWIGGGLMVVACAGFALWQSLAALLVFTAVLGIGHLHAGHQPAGAVRAPRRPGAMDRMVGNYMVANAVGQGIGPVYRGLGRRLRQHPADAVPVHDRARLRVTDVRRLVLAAARAAAAAEARRAASRCRCSEIARIPGIKLIFFVSVVTVAAQDLIVVYLPASGAERACRSTSSACCWRCARWPRWSRASSMRG